MESLFKEKRELFKQWTNLKYLGENEKLNFNQYYRIRQIEQEIYNKWKFLDNYTKAKEKIENEKRKN